MEKLRLNLQEKDDKMSENTTAEPTNRGELLTLTSEVVSAYLSNNAVDHAAVPDLIQAVFTTLSGIAEGEPAPVDLTPAVPIRKSVTHDHLVCLEDGKKLKMLKRHLMTSYGMTPEQYRTKWGLRSDYPMVAPAYAQKRSELATKLGLGRKRIDAPVEAPAEPEPEPKPAPKVRTRRKAA